MRSHQKKEENIEQLLSRRQYKAVPTKKKKIVKYQFKFKPLLTETIE